MKALCYEGHPTPVLRDLPVPEPTANESLIRITFAAICSTDREVLAGYKPDFRGVMGHEFVGVVERSSDASLVGARVVGELNAGCGECIYCRTGREGHCLDRRVIGLTNKDGCFAEYMTLRTDLLHRVPDSLPDEIAVFCEPLAAALEITDKVHVRPSEPLAVVGDGRLSLMIAQVLALTGAEVVVAGKHPEKLARFASFARTEVREGETFELVVDASGSPAGFDLARKLVRHRGTIVLKSTFAEVTPMNISDLVVHEVTVVGSRCGPFEPALRLLERGLVTLPPIELFPLEDHAAAFASRAFKSGFKMQ